MASRLSTICSSGEAAKWQLSCDRPTLEAVDPVDSRDDELAVCTLSLELDS